MKPSKTLLLGIVAAVLVGTLISAGLASAQGRLDDSPMTIPVAQVGDRWSYVVLEPYQVETVCQVTKEEDSVMAVCGPKDEKPHKVDPPKAVGFYQFTNDQVTKTVDRETRLHEVLLMKANLTEIMETIALEGEPGVDPGQGYELREETYSQTYYEYLDLHTRKAVRMDDKFEQNATSIGADFAISTFQDVDSQVPAILYQGQTLRLGDDLTSFYDTAPPFAYAAGWSMASHGGPSGTAVGGMVYRRSLKVHVYSQEMDPNEESPLAHLAFSVQVADRAIIDGLDAYGIVAEAQATIRKGPEFGDWAGRRVFVSETLWLTSTNPYPILIDRQAGFIDDGKEEVFYQQLHVLQDYQPGGKPVPWRTEAGPSMQPLMTLGPSSGQRHPDDGATRLPYKLSDAVADATGPLMPLEFRLWRQSHPNGVLVSAELRKGEVSSAPTNEWHLVWGEPGGGGFEVATERAPGSTVAKVDSRGARTTPSFNLTDFAPNPPTLGAAENVWSVTASADYGALAPNFVHWGLDLGNYRSSRLCLSGDMMTKVSDTASQLRELLVGYTSEGSCVQPPGTLQESATIVRTDTGRVSGHYEIRKEFDFKGSPYQKGTHETPKSSAKIIPAGVQPPKIESAALVSSSLIVVFLTVYFLPALKFVGTKGLFLVPGYAKLRKEELLDNKIRDQILQVVRNDPGVNTTDLAQRVDAGWGTVVYHLGVLEKNEMISSLVDGRYHRFFPIGVIDWSARGQVAAMKNARTKQLYELVLQEPGTAQEVLARRVGISPPAAFWHLKRLEEVGMIGRVKKGRKVHYYANEGSALSKPTSNETGMEIQ